MRPPIWGLKRPTWSPQKSKTKACARKSNASAKPTKGLLSKPSVCVQRPAKPRMQTPHIAEMMINGTTMGIVDMTKKLNQLDEADAGAKKLAEEFIRGQQKSIEVLKQHLS